jgi:NDP-sugar pyrophosphorylase family protein
VLTSPHDFFELNGFAHADIFDGIDHVWQALDRLSSYLDSHGDWRVLGNVAPGAVLRGNVFIGRGTVVEPCAFIIGPAIIGENCTIRHSAYIRGEVIVGDDCIIGHCSELKSSIILNGSNVPHFNYVGDSIIGNDVNLGAGTICANLRLDEGEILINGRTPERESIPTGRQKLGAIIGDGTRTSCNLVLNPGTLLPRGSAVRPSASSAVRVLDRERLNGDRDGDLVGRASPAAS